MLQIRFKLQNGSFLIGALVLATIVGVAVLATTTLVVTQGQAEQIFVNERKAFYAAETGIEYALGVLKDSSDWREGVSKDSLGDIEFSVSLEDKNTSPSLGDTVLVTSIGYKGSIQRSIQVYLTQPGGGPDTDYLVLAGNDIDFSKGKAVVNGNLHANKKVKIGSKYTINGEVTTAPPTIDLPTVDWDFFKNEAIAAGQYVAGDIEFESGKEYSGVWYATGEAKIKDNNVVINGTIVAENNVELKKNNEKITAPAHYPAILTKTDLKVEKNNAEINGLIYCQNLEIKKNNMVINGALVVTNTIKNEKNNTEMNFEPSYLTKIAGLTFSSKGGGNSGPPQVARWRISK